MKKYLLDEHKLNYHPDVIQKFINGEKFPPMSVEISPTARCNQHCTFCYVEYVMKPEYSPKMMDNDLLFKVVKDCGEFGVKAISFCGTGEPLLHPKLPEAISYARSFGIDTALVTNGVLAAKDKMESCLGDLTWMRVSSSAGSPQRYAKLQGSTEKAFFQMKDNLRGLVEIKRRKNLKTTIGLAYFLFDGCQEEMIPFVSELKEIGIDYVQIKPLGDFEKNNYVYKKGAYRILQSELQEAEKLSSEDFYVQIKHKAFERVEKVETEGYFLPEKCWGLLFFTTIGSDGNVYTCSGSWYEKEDSYGSLKDNTLREIWASERFQRIFERRSKTDHKLCFMQCHNIPMNAHLMDLKSPPEHVNFI
jgi:GTP 3',8-cyclase